MIWTWKRQVLLGLPVLGIAVMCMVSAFLPKEAKLPIWATLSLIAIQWLILAATWNAKPWSLMWLARAMVMEHEKLAAQVQIQIEEEEIRAEKIAARGSDPGTEGRIGALRRWLRARVRPRHRGAAGDGGGPGPVPPGGDEREDFHEGPDADHPGTGDPR